MDNNPNGNPPRPCKLYAYNNDPAKKWLLCWYQYNCITGKIQRRVFKEFNNIKDPKARLREARKWEQYINACLVSGKVYDPTLGINPATKPKQPETLKQDYQDMINAKKVSVSAMTIRAYESFWYNWEQYLKQVHLEKILTKEVTPELCQGFQDHLIKQPLSNKTRNNYTNCLRSFLNYYTVIGRKRFDSSPAQYIQPLPVTSESDEPFSPKQASAIIDSIREEKDFQLLLFVYFIQYTFARPGFEIRLLKVRDIRERVVVYVPKNSKTNLIKTPTIPYPLEQLINELGIREYPDQHYVFSLLGTPGPNPVSRNYFYKRHRAILEELDFTGKYTLYSWKYTGNIQAFKSGVGLKSIQDQNGHTNLRTTEKYLKRLGVFVDNDIYEKFR